MQHKAEWMGRPMRLELTRVGLLVLLANHYTTRGAHCTIDIYIDIYLYLYSYQSLSSISTRLSDSMEFSDSLLPSILIRSDMGKALLIVQD